MIIKPIRDKETKKVLSNREICSRMYDEISRLYNSDDADDRKIAVSMCGSQANTVDVLELLKAVKDAPSDREGNRILNESLIPISPALLKTK